MNSIHLMVIIKIVINKKWNLIEMIEIYEVVKLKRNARKNNKNIFIKFVLLINT